MLLTFAEEEKFSAAFIVCSFLLMQYLLHIEFTMDKHLSHFQLPHKSIYMI